jgi:hypothetical protein
MRKTPRLGVALAALFVLAAATTAALHGARATEVGASKAPAQARGVLALPQVSSPPTAPSRSAGDPGTSAPTVAAPTRPSSPNVAQPILGQAGAYYVPAGDQAGLPSLGLSLVLGSDFGGPPAPAPGGARTSHLRYIDTTIWEVISKYVPQSCQSMTTPCAIPAATRRSLINAVQARIAQVHGNTSVAGLYILDDYPGNIVDILDQVHAMVAADNRTEATPRPTLCAFGATLDTRQQPGTPLVSHADGNPNGQNFARGLTNFSSSACDAVSIYPYDTPGANASQVDWSMSQLLPSVLRQLSQRGWNPALEPLIGTPQAFGYPAGGWNPPTGAELRAQTDAFCHAGARSIIAYAWDDDYTSPRVELFNSADLRDGLLQGVVDCKRAWSSG